MPTTRVDGETSPLLTPSPTLRDSDSDSYYAARDPRASFLWLLPAAAMATLSNAITAYSRQMFFSEFVCEEILPSPDPSLLQMSGDIPLGSSSKLDCTSSPFFSGFMTVNIASMVITCVLCSLTTGWWSRQGDHYGRRYALMVSAFGSILLNFIFALVAGNPAFVAFAQPSVVIGLLLEGLLGGSATFRAALHAYAADTSPAGSWSTSFSLLQGVFILCTILGNWVGIGFDFFKPFLSFGVSTGLGLINLVYIFFFLPESLPEDFEFNRPSKPSFKDIRQTIYSTITIFAAGQRMTFLALASFLYFLTSGVESFQLIFVLRRDHPSPSSLPASFIIISLLARMATFFFVFPGILYALKRRTPLSLAVSTKQYFLSVTNLDASAARYSVFIDLMTQLFILVVPAGPSVIFFLLALIAPLTAGTKPALYALTAASFEFRGGAPRRGALFGAISVLGLLGETLSSIMYVSTNNLWRSFPKAGFLVTAALLGVVALFLWPAERIAPDITGSPDRERIRIVVSHETTVSGNDQDAATLSPVYRRHGANSGDTH